jgi:hypothetical protein
VVVDGQLGAEGAGVVEADVEALHIQLRKRQPGSCSPCMCGLLLYVCIVKLPAGVV